MRKHKLTFSPVPASSMQKATLCPIEGVFWPPSAARGGGAHRQGDCRRLAAETKGDRTPYGFLSPLDSPYLPFKPRLPAVARLNARGPQGRLVLQGYTLDRSGAFRSRTRPPCTVWPRTVMRGKSRKRNSGKFTYTRAEKRPEPSPVPCLDARPKGVASKGR